MTAPRVFLAAFAAMFLALALGLPTAWMIDEWRIEVFAATMECAPW